MSFTSLSCIPLLTPLLQKHWIMRYTYPTWLTGIVLTIALVAQPLNGVAQYERTTVDGSIIDSTPSKTIFTSDGATLELSKHGTEMLLRKYAEDGTMLWGQSLPLTSFGNNFDVAPDQQGGAAIGLYVGGTPYEFLPDSVEHYLHFLSFDANGVITHAKKITRDIFTNDPAGDEFRLFLGLRIQTVSPAGYVVTCNYSTTTYSTVDLFRLTENLDLGWIKSIGEVTNTGVSAVPTLIYTNWGLTEIVTKPYGNGDLLLLKNSPMVPLAMRCTKIDPNGAVAWTKLLQYTNTGLSLDHIAVVVANSGSIHIAAELMLPTGFFCYMPILSGTGELLDASLYEVNLMAENARLTFDDAGNRLLFRSEELLIADTLGGDARLIKTKPVNVGSNTVTLNYKQTADYLDGSIIRDMTMIHQDQITAFSVYRSAQLRLPYDQLPSCYFEEDTIAHFQLPLSILSNTDNTEISSVDVSAYYTIMDTTITTQTIQDLDWTDLCSFALGINENPTSTEQQLLYPTLLTAGQPLTIAADNVQRIEIWNTSGLLIQKHSVSSDRSVPTNSLAPGMYAVKAYGAVGRVLGTTRLVVE